MVDPQDLSEQLAAFSRLNKDLKVDPRAAALVVVAAQLKRIADALEAQNP